MPDYEPPMPKHYYRAEQVRGAYSDKAWINQQLSSVSPGQRNFACVKYSEAYQSLGRTEANTKLRLYVERCISTNNGMTVAPPRMPAS